MKPSFSSKLQRNSGDRLIIFSTFHEAVYKKKKKNTPSKILVTWSPQGSMDSPKRRSAAISFSRRHCERNVLITTCVIQYRYRNKIRCSDQRNKTVCFFFFYKRNFFYEQYVRISRGATDAQHTHVSRKQYTYWFVLFLFGMLISRCCFRCRQKWRYVR